MLDVFFLVTSQKLIENDGILPSWNEGEIYGSDGVKKETWEVLEDEEEKNDKRYRMWFRVYLKVSELIGNND